MCGPEKEIELKTALVQARRSIRKKFKRLHNERILQDNVLNETFAPITTSIDRLVDLTTPQKTNVKPKFLIKNELKVESKQEVKNEPKSEAQSSDNKTMQKHDRHINNNSIKLKGAVSLPNLSKQNVKEEKQENRNYDDGKDNDVIDLDEPSDPENMSVDKYTDYRRLSLIRDVLFNHFNE